MSETVKLLNITIIECNKSNNLKEAVFFLKTVSVPTPTATDENDLVELQKVVADKDVLYYLKRDEVRRQINTITNTFNKADIITKTFVLDKKNSEQLLSYFESLNKERDKVNS